MAGTDVLTTSDGIAGTNDDPLFQTMRVGEMFRYRFTLTPGDYRVRLLFAEIYWESGDAEKEDIFVSGRKVLTGYNIFDEAGHDVISGSLGSHFPCTRERGRAESRSSHPRVRHRVRGGSALRKERNEEGLRWKAKRRDRST
jgi:hypothetical protein